VWGWLIALIELSRKISQRKGKETIFFHHLCNEAENGEEGREKGT